MSAPQIPHLKTLRRGGSRGRGRGREATTTAQNPSGAPSKEDRDRVIQSTDFDAAASRLSAVQNGYLDDPFAKLLIADGDVVKRLPLMNRGTYVRTTAIDRLVDGFLTGHPPGKRQIISLGAGSDTRFFRLSQKYPDVDFRYHELDFPTNTTTKIRRLRTPSLVKVASTLCHLDLLSSNIHISPGSASLISLGSPDYFIHPVDIRTLRREERDQGSGGNQTVHLSGVLTTIPTLLISECCLIYLSPEEADTVLQYFTSIFARETPLGVVIYEPIRPHDAFGRTMVSNLTARGIHLQTLNAHDTLEAQKARLQRHGLGHEHGGSVGAEDLDFVWDKWIADEEKERVEGLEWMDEVEEWKLLMQHYCIAWACRDGDEDVSGVFKGWKKLPRSNIKA